MTKMQFNIRDKMMEPTIIKGGSHTDQRGTLSFVNDFDMGRVKRFYTIDHPTHRIVRAWRGHRIEQRWFYVVEGAFLLRLVKIDYWESPTKNLPIAEYKLFAKDQKVLHVPNGYASWLQATEDHSKIILFGDYGIEHAKLDNYLYPMDYFEGVIKQYED